MKKVKKIITGFLTVFIFMALVLPMTTVKASEEKEVVEKRMYTVTFRAGNIACFDIDKITVSEGMEVTKNYIKVKVAKGDTLAFTVPGWESDARLTSWFSNCLHYEKEAAYGLKAPRCFSRIAFISASFVVPMPFTLPISPIISTIFTAGLAGATSFPR